MLDLYSLKPFWFGLRYGSVLWRVLLRIVILASFGDIEDNAILL